MTIESEAERDAGMQSESRLALATPQPERLTLIDLWRVLLKRRLTILIVTILTLAGSLWYALRTPSLYENVSQIEIRPNEAPNVGLQELVGQGESSQNALQTEVRVLQSDSVLFQAAQGLNLISLLRGSSGNKNAAGIPVPAADITPMERRALVGMIRGGLIVTIILNTNIVEIRYRSTDPKLGAAIVNQLVETYSDEDLRSKYERTLHVSTWLRGQLNGLQQQAADAQRQLAEYQRAHNIVGTDENSNLTIQTLQQVSAALDGAEADRILKEARMRDFDSTDSELVGLMGDNPVVNSLRSRLLELQAQRAELAMKNAANHPRMRDLNTQINKVEAQIQDEVVLARRQVRNQYQGALHAEQALHKRLVAQEDEAYKLSEGVAQYSILRHQAEAARNLFDTLEMRLKEAGVTAGLSAANITVIDRAEVPFIPIAPKKRAVMIMGLLGGLVGGSIMAFVLESIDDRLQTSEEVESASQLPSLAAIPHIGRDLSGHKARGKADGAEISSQVTQRLVSLRDPKSSGAEAFRSLRSALLLSSIDNPPRMIVFTSALPGEGKTNTAVNCAIVLAQRGERVLLVDADLRRGSLFRVFGIDRNVGLSTMLAHPGDHEIPVPLPELPGLYVLSTGPRPPNPAEMLSSARMEEQLQRWRQEFDRIVIDSAPVLAVSDTLALAVRADSVVVISRAGMTRKRALIRARDLLLRVNAPLIGVVVNDVDLRLENFYTYRRGYGYHYGYGSRSSDKAYGYQDEDDDNKGE